MDCVVEGVAVGLPVSVGEAVWLWVGVCVVDCVVEGVAVGLRVSVGETVGLCVCDAITTPYKVSDVAVGYGDQLLQPPSDLSTIAWEACEYSIVPAPSFSQSENPGQTLVGPAVVPLNTHWQEDALPQRVALPVTAKAVPDKLTFAMPAVKSRPARRSAGEGFRPLQEYGCENIEYPPEVYVPTNSS